MTEMQAALLLAQMEYLEEQVGLREKNAQLLNQRLAEIPGIQPMKRYPQVTRQSYYCFFFRYSSPTWDGIPGDVFRKALGAEVALSVGSTYQPLNNCSLYQPHTKRRHRLNDEYWAAINPQRFELPVCERAFMDEAIVIWHPFLLSGQDDILQVVQAVEKLYENRTELRRCNETEASQ
jgi:L-glutamine:2-deoxy-scyllo-inosose/3-amino-2,3-dideoxy-scyllo-inosose aminotransferase